MTPHPEQNSPPNTPKRSSKRSKSSPKTPKRNRAPNERQEMFAMAYVELRSQGIENGTEAARRAGYKGRPDTLAKTARANLQNPQIQAMIQEMTKSSIEMPRPKALKRFPFVLGINETMAMASFLAAATFDDVLNDEGRFDIEKARETGGIHALTRIKVSDTTRTLKDGSQERRVTHDLAIEPRSRFIDLIGRNLELWEGIGNPIETIRRLMRPLPPAPGSENEYP